MIFNNCHVIKTVKKQSVIKMLFTKIVSKVCPLHVNVRTFIQLILLPGYLFINHSH